MIPVTPKPEPENFDRLVRKPGNKWLVDHGVSPDQPPPDPSMLPTYWRQTQKELWESYDGVCAYLCIYFEWVIGAHSTDHFIAKSREAGQVYEWSNYRLSCMSMNRNKNHFDDILDPFQINPYTFLLNLASGLIYPNPELSAEIYEKAEKTILRLKLNDIENQEMRAWHFTLYQMNEISVSYLKRTSPFVWYEVNRQGLL